MEDKIKKQSIDRLNISVSILEGLKQNNIIKIEDLCKKSKSTVIPYGTFIFYKLFLLHLKLSNKFSLS